MMLGLPTPALNARHLQRRQQQPPPAEGLRYRLPSQWHRRHQRIPGLAQLGEGTQHSPSAAQRRVEFAMRSTTRSSPSAPRQRLEDRPQQLHPQRPGANPKLLHPSVRKSPPRRGQGAPAGEPKQGNGGAYRQLRQPLLQVALCEGGWIGQREPAGIEQHVAHRVTRVEEGVRRSLVAWATARDVSQQYEPCTHFESLDPEAVLVGDMQKREGEA